MFKTLIVAALHAGALLINVAYLIRGLGDTRKQPRLIPTRLVSDKKLI